MLENSCQPSSECQKAIYDGYIYIAFINSSGQILGVVRKDRKSEPVDSFFWSTRPTLIEEGGGGAAPTARPWITSTFGICVSHIQNGRKDLWEITEQFCFLLCGVIDYTESDSGDSVVSMALLSLIPHCLWHRRVYCTCQYLCEFEPIWPLKQCVMRFFPVIQS